MLAEISEHLSLVSRPEGLFTDTQVTGQVWRGQQRRVRCCVYKRFARLSDDPQPAVEQIESVSVTLMATFSEAGIQAKRCDGRALYEWLLPFFNRKAKKIFDGDTSERHAELREVVSILETSLPVGTRRLRISDGSLLGEWGKLYFNR